MLRLPMLALNNIKSLGYSRVYSPVWCRGFAVTGRHSKNVAGKKNKLDERKMKLYNRMTIAIIIAAKAGGADPSSNLFLARRIREANAVNLPKDNIERALKKASEVSADDYVSGVYEVFGFGGVGIVVTTLTDNSNRAVKEIKKIVKKADMKAASGGSVLFSFEQKGVVSLPTLGSHSEDSLLEAAIEAGVDAFDVYPVSSDDEDAVNTSAKFVIHTSVDSIGLVLDVLDKLGIGENVTSSKEYFPVTSDGSPALVEISAEDFEKNMKVIDELEELDDVDKVFHNMKI